MIIDVIAIDPSLTCTGVVKGNKKDFKIKTFKSAPVGQDLFSRLERVVPLVLDVKEFCSTEKQKKKPLILIEGYSFGSRGRATLSIAELGGMFRWEISELGNLIEVPPTQLKKFTTGKGNCKKHEMAISVYKRWNVDFKTEDEVDAFALFQLGLAVVGKKTFKQQYSMDVVELVKENNGL